MAKFVEYRVRPVKRYVLTIYTRDGAKTESKALCEFDNQFLAHDVAETLNANAPGGLGVLLAATRVSDDGKSAYTVDE